MMKQQPFDNTKLSEDFQTLADQENKIKFELTFFDCWVLLGLIQLALRHPLNRGGSAKIGYKIAKQIEARVTITENLKRLAELGWTDVEYEEVFPSAVDQSPTGRDTGQGWGDLGNGRK